MIHKVNTAFAKRGDFVLINHMLYLPDASSSLIILNKKKVFSIIDHILVFISLNFLRHLFQHWFHAARAKVCQHSLSFCSIIQHVLGSSTTHTVLIKETFTQLKKSNNLLFGKISGKNQDTVLHLPENIFLPLYCRNIVFPGCSFHLFLSPHSNRPTVTYVCHWI